MNRRQLLKLLALGVGSLELDIDSLLWVPGKKTIFISNPPKSISMSQIVAMEYERILPRLKGIFEQDNMFYEVLAKEAEIISEREMRIPLELFNKPTDGKVH